VARIVAGDLDAYSGRFVDATVDLDEIAGAPDGETLRLRLVGPSLR
jgi:hypothetical protein